MSMEWYTILGLVMFLIVAIPIGLYMGICLVIITVCYWKELLAAIIILAMLLGGAVLVLGTPWQRNLT